MENRRTITAAESYSHGQSLGALCIYGAFFRFTHKKHLPHPTNIRWTRVSRFFSEFQHCVGWGDGKLQENVEKDALFVEGT